MPFIVIFKEERIFCVIDRNNKGILNIISFFFSLSKKLCVSLHEMGNQTL